MFLSLFLTVFEGAPCPFVDQLPIHPSKATLAGNNNLPTSFQPWAPVTSQLSIVMLKPV